MPLVNFLNIKKGYKMKKTKFIILALLFVFTLNTQIAAQDNIARGVEIIYRGKTYQTIQLGGQCWFKENLDVGTMLNVSSHQTRNDTIEKYCYNDDPANCEIYGGLYQWDEAMQYVKTEGAQGVCPAGWHIPTKEDWEILQEYVHDEAAKLIAKNAKSGNTYTNDSGFSALFSGYSNAIWGCFYGSGYYGYYWSSSETSEQNAYGIFMSYNYDNIYFKYDKKKNGLAVRCIKD
jgi:uncharacterized protein (TIGR02145 family)